MTGKHFTTPQKGGNPLNVYKRRSGEKGFPVRGQRKSGL